jgi:acetyl esterase/lipase
MDSAPGETCSGRNRGRAGPTRAGDKLVSVEHTLLYTAALREHGIPHELHLYQSGGHGTGLIGTGHPWFGDLLFWLCAHGFVAGKIEANQK